jgi:hypothetical protein
MGNRKIINIGTPTTSTDCANKSYVDNITISTDKLTTSTNGISNNVKIVKGGDVSLFIDNIAESGIWNGWTKCGFKATHTTQTAVRYMTISNDRLMTTQTGSPGVELFEIYRNSNTLAGYCNSTGSWLTSSDINLKHSIKNKRNNDNKDYLERIMKLNIYSYCYKDEENEHINNNINVGVIY